MGIKIVLLVLFFAVMVAVGVYSRKHEPVLTDLFLEEGQ